LPKPCYFSGVKPLQKLGIQTRFYAVHTAPPIDSIKARMSSERQATERSPNLTGLGYFPDLTPFKNVVRPMGRMAGMGGLAFGLPIICQSRNNAHSCRWWGWWLDCVAMLCTSLMLVVHSYDILGIFFNLSGIQKAVLNPHILFKGIRLIYKKVIAAYLSVITF
jgi:hypothetical protein